MRHFDRPRDFVERVIRLCSPSTRSFRLTSGASFETREVPFSHLHWIDSCGACYTMVYFPSSFSCSLAFKAVIHPPFTTSRVIITFSILAFRAISPVLVFRAIISFSFGVQSHHVFSFTTFRVVFLSLTFLVTSLVGRSEPLFHFGVQSRVLFLSASRAIACLRFGIQSHRLSSFRRSEQCFVSFGVQSHCLFSFRRSESCFVSAWHSKSLFIFVSAFRAVFYFI